MITMTQRRATSFFERSSGRYRPRDSTSTTFAAQRIERTSWIHSLQARSSDPGGTLQPATTGPRPLPRLPGKSPPRPGNRPLIAVHLHLKAARQCSTWTDRQRGEEGKRVSVRVEQG